LLRNIKTMANKKAGSILLTKERSEGSERTKEHKFWDTQPVPRLDDRDLHSLECGEPIEPDKPTEEIQAVVYPLLEQFEWVECDLDNPQQLDELYQLLYENYVEDGDACFRFDYSRPFLRWALQPPGWRKEWHVGVRVKASGKLIAFISAIPATITVRETTKHMVEINFMCVVKKLRSKRLAPILIKEITRRVNLTGVFQALYTGGTVLPTPIVQCRYWHRSLNAKKLIEIGFSRLPPRMTMKATLKLYSLPVDPLIPGIRPMEMRDTEKARILLEGYLHKYCLRPEFNEEEFQHWFLPRDDVIYTFVVEDPANSDITDLISFYSLPSSVIQHEKHKTLRAAYSFYNVPGKASLCSLMRDALILAKNCGFDVFNALDLMENANMFRELHFRTGDGTLNYYVFNWKTRPLECSENGLVML